MTEITNQIKTDISVEENSKNEYLIFLIDNNHYAINIYDVHEIKSYFNIAINSSKNAPSFLKGITHMENMIVPIFDLRLLFSLDQLPYDNYTIVIFINVNSTFFGVIVDSVSDIISLMPDQIKPAPDCYKSMYKGCIENIGTIGDRMLFIINSEKLLLVNELVEFNNEKI
jgi:purine-binding chemotaxis protein CheW